MEAQSPQFLVTPHGDKLAYHFSPGKEPGLIFLGGFRSDMSGTKALYLENFCRQTGRQFTRFDYFAHGQSPGNFIEGTISRWKENALAMLDQVTTGKQILVGSSMGGWIMLLVARERPERIAGLVGIAAAPDFTEDLMWSMMTTPQKKELLRTGILFEPSDYSDEPYAITLKLIEDGRSNLVLRTPLPIHCPVRLLHGMKDEDVPWQLAQRLAEHLPGTDKQILYVAEGDHRLSREEDLALLEKCISSI